MRGPRCRGRERLLLLRCVRCRPLAGGFGRWLMISVFLVDDHGLVRRGVAETLDDEAAVLATELRDQAQGHEI